MKPRDIKTLDIKSVGNLVTVVDQPDAPSIYALETVGFRPAREGMIGGERDFGTNHRYTNYPNGRKIISNHNIYDKNTNTTYELVACLDGSNNLEVFVLDTTYGSDSWNALYSNNNWINLTAKDTATLSSISGTTATLSSPVTTANNQLKNWIIVNNTLNKVAFITSSTSSTNQITTDTNLSALGWSTAHSYTLYRNTGIYSNFNPSNGQYPHIRWDDFEAQTAAFLFYGFSSAPDNYPTPRRPLRIQRYTSDRKYFYQNSSDALVTLSKNWYVDSGGGGLIPAFKTVGSISAPIDFFGQLIKLTGTVSIGAGSSWVAGTGTLFLSECRVGQYIAIVGSRRIISILSDTTLVVESQFNDSGSGLDGYVVAPQDAEIDDISGDKWLKIRAYTTGEVRETYNTDISKKTAARIYITVTYDDGTKENDPIYQLFCDPTAATLDQEFTDVSFVVGVNFAKMNKRISGLRFYYNAVDVSKIGFSGVPDASSDYKLVYELPFNSYDSQSTWTLDSSNQLLGSADTEYIYRVVVPDFKYSFVNSKLQSGVPSVKDNIGHEVDTNRSYLTPRFSVSASRGGGGIRIVDQGDSVLRLSSYNGSGIHEEDNFPDVTLDNVSQRQKIFLQSRGELIGLGVASGNVLAFKRTELEIVNLVANNQQIIPIDCIARKSIISTPYGVFWAGRAGIFLFASDGSGIKIVNPLWKNLYDGTLRTDDGANPRISDSDRANIIAGYNPVYREVWFYLPTRDPDGTLRKLCYRYFIEQNEWRARELNIGTDSSVQLFTTRRDNTFTIGYGHSTSSTGLLAYPTTHPSMLWEDDVQGVSANKGIPTRLAINVGEFYGISQNAVLYSIFVDAIGKMKPDTSGRFNIELYANRETVAFEKKAQIYDKPPIPRLVPPRGPIERLKIVLSLPQSNANYKDWTISQITLEFLERQRLGKR